MPLTPEQYLRPDVIQQVQRLDLKARFIIEGFLAGLHRSPMHGFSVEFSEHRKYNHGDDLRLIDWGVYAKTDRFYIKTFQAETNLEAYLLMDCSGSMDYAAGGRMTKMDYAICLAAALGYMMIRQQDPIGLFTFDEKLLAAVPARSKRSHLTDILTTLARTRPFGRTGLARSIHEIAERVRKRSLMILLSDLLDDDEAGQGQVVEALHHLRHRGHDVIVFEVLDHAERTLEFDGQVNFEDPETNETLRTDARSIQAAYREAVEAFIEEYRTECQAMAADFIVVDNAMTFDKALVEFLIQRQERF